MDVVLDNKNVGSLEMEEAVVRPKKEKKQWKLIAAEDKLPALIKSGLSEFLGTALLILICVGSANSWVFQSLASSTVTLSPLYYLGIALAFGLGIAGIVHICGEASGGHVNPAVSFGLFLDRRISLVRLAVYTVAQFAGGFAGAGVLYGSGNHSEVGMISGGNSYNTSTLNHAQAFYLEGFGTMFLVLTVLSTLSESRGHHASYLQPFSIGVAITVINIWLIPYTNCGINPVRGVVWNVVIGQTSTKQLIFAFAPFVGSGAAVLLSSFVFNSPYW